jgi:hypothetical protein
LPDYHLKGLFLSYVRSIEVDLFDLYGFFLYIGAGVSELAPESNIFAEIYR